MDVEYTRGYGKNCRLVWLPYPLSFNGQSSRMGWGKVVGERGSLF